MRSNAYCGNLLWQPSLTLQTPKTLTAFERHWYPEAITSGATNTLERLSAVARALK